MKKFFLSTMLLVGSILGAYPATILSEDFSSLIVPKGQWFTEIELDGWSKIDGYTGDVEGYNWCIYNEGSDDIPKNVAYVDGMPDKTGPREEFLLTPELTIDDTYQLSFTWAAASASALRDGEYDFQIRIIEQGQDVKQAPVIWSFLDADMLRNSGIVNTESTDLWIGWRRYLAKIDLDQYQGKTIRVAFVYKVLKDKANCVKLDDVVVKTATIATTPKPTLSRTSYTFGKVFVGSKVFSDVMKLTNTGKDGLQVSSVTLPAGFSLVTAEDITTLNIKKNESVDFQICYDASLTSAANGDVVFATNGGDVKLSVSAVKEMLPEGSLFEGFESGVPPAGWKANGWRQTGYALEGNYSAYSSGSIDGTCDLITPRLDLSTGQHSISFTYFNQYDSETGDTNAENYINISLSTDGGKTWTKKDVIDYNDPFNTVKQVTVDLGSPASDNCYVKWTYGGLTYDPEYGASEFSIFFLDCVVLPHVYGAGGVPVAGSVVAPADKATDIFNKEVELSWTSAQFAEGYRLYVGTDAAATDLINGKDLGDALTYTIDRLEYGKTYNWKVVPYNTQGDAENVAMWSFTTISDMTVSQYPYFEGFENGVPPMGWQSKKIGYAKWGANEIDPYEGKASAFSSATEHGEDLALESPEFILPDSPMLLTFVWGDAPGISLKKDETGMIENTATESDGIAETVCEILADGQWHQLAILSDKENLYWLRERIDLTPYAGKRVALRWVYKTHNYLNAHGSSIDNIRIESASDEAASFNLQDWNAGKVNWKESYNSGNIFTLLNDGKNELTIKSVSFNTPNFKSSLETGNKVASGKGLPFSITFNALEASAEVNDMMKVEFESGLTVEMPVKGNALAEDVRFYGFENDEYGSLTPDNFVTIDVDRKSTIELALCDYEHYGEKFAFMVMNYKKANWGNPYPNTGDQMLVAFGANDYTTTEDWIVSNSMVATENSSFTFYARNYEHKDNTGGGEVWGAARATVLVSTTSRTDTKQFEEVETFELIYPEHEEYGKYTVDLSKYAGQAIFVAIRNYVNEGLAYFFDDFQFDHFAGFDSGVDFIEADGQVIVYPNPATENVYVKGVEPIEITVTSMAGAVVAKANATNMLNVSELPAGIYFVTVKAENGVSTKRIVKK